MDYESQLRKLQLLELNLAVELKRVCEKNDIQYFMLFGSLLGAVRHGGFIPWDNDMDFGMLRSEYEKFVKACEKDLNKDKYFLQTWDTDPLFPFQWAKLQLKGTRFMDEIEPGNPNNGIAIDIFPYDSAPPQNRIKIESMKVKICTRIMLIKKGYKIKKKADTLVKKVVYLALYILSKFVSGETVKRYILRTVTKHNGIVTDDLTGEGTIMTTIKREWAMQLEPVLFETEVFPAFRRKEEYLTFTYGDWMKMPPVCEQEAHTCLMLDFGPYA